MLISYIRTPRKEVAYLVHDKETQINYADVKNVGGDPIGIIVAIDRNKVGWALCHPQDKFNKSLGMIIATNRAKNPEYDKKYVLDHAPKSLRKELIKMYDRSQRYYNYGYNYGRAGKNY